MQKYKTCFKTYPSLDLHGETRDTFKQPVNEFINDNLKLANFQIAIIHGIGSGILKQELHNLLKKDKRVESYYLQMSNPGCTIVKLKDN